MIPKLTPINDGDKETDKLIKRKANVKNETSKEREERIKKTEVSIADFFSQCVDYDMLKLFFGLLLIFFCTVGLATLFYLFFIYLFKAKMWNFYFPSHEAHEEL